MMNRGSFGRGGALMAGIVLIGAAGVFAAPLEKKPLNCASPSSIRAFKKIIVGELVGTEPVGRKVADDWARCLCGEPADDAGFPVLPPSPKMVPARLACGGGMTKEQCAERDASFFKRNLPLTDRDALRLARCSWGVAAEQAPVPLPGAPLFRDLTFDAALKQAGAEKKIVMVDFYTDMCVPCKRMDLTTWQDPGVAAFLAERAISVRLDADKEPGLSKRYNLREFPTMLLLRPDGTQIDRLVGFLPADKFLSEFKDGLAGKTALQRARAAVAASKGDAIRLANARKDLAGVLAQNGDGAGALKEYLWLFDDGMKKLPDFAGVRVSYVLMEIKSLGDDYPPALAALRARRDAAKKALQGPGFTDADGKDFSALNWALGEPKATLALYDSFPAGDPRRKALGHQVFDDLLSARRYAESADVQPAERIRAELEAGAKESWGPTQDSDKEMLRMNREYHMRNAAEGLEVLAGAGKLDDAKDLIRRVLAVEDSPWVRALLREHLERAGQAALLSSGS